MIPNQLPSESRSQPDSRLALSCPIVTDTPASVPPPATQPNRRAVPRSVRPGTWTGFVALQGAHLQEVNWAGVDLRSANLEQALMQRADLSGADLRGANLRWTYLDRANLQGADLRYADLTGAYLRGADLRGADLRYANLWGALLWDVQLEGALRDQSLGE